MAVELSAGESLEPGRPQALFRADVFGRLNTYRTTTVTADASASLSIRPSETSRHYDARQLDGSAEAVVARHSASFA